MDIKKVVYLIVFICTAFIIVFLDFGLKDVPVMRLSEPLEDNDRGPALAPRGREEEMQTLEIMVVGDIMMHMPQITAGKTADGYDYRQFFAEVSPILSEADLTLGNLETTLAGPARGFSGYPAFNAPDELLDALQSAGFDIITTSNNHSLDTGEAGVVRTLDQLDAANIPHTGTARSPEEQEQVLIVKKNEISLAILAYTYASNAPIPQGKDYLVNQIDLQQIEKDIIKARELGADLVAVCLHYGNEYEIMPNSNQIIITDAVFSYGADLIFGSHPHVLQPYELREWTTEEGEEREGVVIYSLGNFISSQKPYPKNVGGILSVIVKKWRGEVDITDVDFHTTYVHRYHNDANQLVFKVLPMEELVTARTESSLSDAEYHTLTQQYQEITEHMVKAVTRQRTNWLSKRIYVTKRGDNIYTLAKLFQTTPDRIITVNPEINPNRLHIGQMLRVPPDEMKVGIAGLAAKQKLRNLRLGLQEEKR